MNQESAAAGAKSFDEVRANWEGFARTDPFVAIYDEPGHEHIRTDTEAFYALGRQDIEEAFRRLGSLGIHPPPDGRALDFGCGAGRLTQALAPHFTSCVGVDASETMVELARAHNAFGDRCSYLVSGSDLRIFESASFDLVYTSAVLQHMDPGLALRYVGEFVRIVRPDGTVVFDMPEARGGRPFAALQALVRLRERAALRTRVRIAVQRARGKPAAALPPHMDMFTTDEATVNRTVEQAGGRVLHVRAHDKPSRTFGGLLGRLVRRLDWGYQYKQYTVTIGS